MKLYLVRHGQTDNNYNSILVGGNGNVQLNERGVLETQKLKDKIKDIEFDACFTSPLIRTWSTAMILVGDKIEIKEDKRLIERNLGNLEGKDFSCYDIDKYYDYSLNCSDENVEPVRDLYARCNDFLNYLKDNFKDDDKILVVTHYGIIKTLHHIINNTKLDGVLEDIKIENCYYKCYEI